MIAADQRTSFSARDMGFDYHSFLGCDTMDLASGTQPEILVWVLRGGSMPDRPLAWK